MTDPSAGYAISQDDALTRYDRWKSRDPFPSIPAALLNSADFLDYVAATGMIFPFEEEPSRLKPASYLASMGGPYAYWDGKGKKHTGDLSRDDVLELPQNTIVFVTLEPFFRLPEYMALRFNLQIKYIHAGLLVGTGPLVDPGFAGRLTVPLHNLTDNDLSLAVTDGLVWIEFTKTSPQSRLTDARGPAPAPTPPRTGKYYSFPKSKKSRNSLAQYLQAAYPGKIRSSIPAAIDEGRRMIRRVTGFGIIALVAVGLGIFGLIFSSLQLVQGTHSLINSVKPEPASDIIRLTQEVSSLQREVARLQLQIRGTPSP